MSAEIITALLVGSLAAGWVDAVVGGGGLILIPLILVLNPSMAPAQALATNKVAAIFGTSSAAITLSRRVPSALHALKYAPLALVGSAAGALLAASVDKQVMRPVIIVLLVAVGVFTVARPSFGAAKGSSAGPTAASKDAEKNMPVRRWMGLLALVGAIGVYDGVFGPGTGLFLIMGLVALLGTDFIASAARAKIINVSTNIGALITFGLQGEVLWLLGLALAVTNVVGAQIGARMVLGRGTGFVRVVLLVVVVVMAGKLALDQVGITG